MEDDFFEKVNVHSPATKMIKEKLVDCVNGIPYDMDGDIISIDTDDCPNMKVIKRDGKHIVVCETCASVFMAEAETEDADSPGSDDETDVEDEFFSRVLDD